MLARLGNAAVGLLGSIGDASLFALKAAREIFVPPFEIRETIRQIYELGLRSAPLIAVSGVAVGVVLSMHTRASLERFGAEAMIPAGLAIALVRETGPLTAGLLLSGRIGAGIGAELGAMRVTEQIDALEVMATDPVHYLVVPRVWATTLMLPLLVAMGNGVGIFGGYLVSVVLMQANPVSYVDRTFQFMDLNDLFSGLIKAAVFGFLLALIGCQQGFYTTGGAEGVGRSTTAAVVVASIAILISDFFLTRLLF